VCEKKDSFLIDVGELSYLRFQYKLDGGKAKATFVSYNSPLTGK
jgi:hypothetical protein